MAEDPLPRSGANPVAQTEELTRDDDAGTLDALAVWTTLVPAGPRLVHRGLLGEGGMGKVMLAEQRAVGREIAVKELREEARTPAKVRRLLQEAWVLGQVQHPNVVTLLDVDQDDEGFPRLWMERARGAPWQSVMHDVPTLAAHYGADDPLRFNIQALIEVCHAVAYAHSRGIVHRDLKPENVMVGRYGEVVVLDWGLAVALDEVTDPRAPLARDARMIAGTPSYMAPEMLGDTDAPLTAATDVYLLGAMLYEILTGNPPHRGDDLREIFASVKASAPVFTEDTPRELAEICRKAMAPRAEGRFESVVGLRKALQSALLHQDSREQADRGAEILADMLRSATGTEGDIVDVDVLFDEARATYRAALEKWPDNLAAQVGLHEVTRRMIEHRLHTRRAAEAEALLRGMDDAPADLAERVEKARRREEDDRERGRAIRRAFDYDVGRRARTILAMSLGTLWTLAPLTLHVVRNDQVVEDRARWALPALYLLGLGLIYLAARTRFGVSIINRIVILTVAFVLTGEFLFGAAAHALGADVIASDILVFSLRFLGAGLLGAVADRRFGWVALLYVSGLVAAVSFPDARHLITGVCNFITTAYAIFLWALPQSRQPTMLSQARLEAERASER